MDKNTTLKKSKKIQKKEKKRKEEGIYKASANFLHGSIRKMGLCGPNRSRKRTE